MSKKNNKIKMSAGEKTFQVFNYIFMMVLMIITIYPFLYVVFGSFSDPVELGKVTGVLLRSAGFSLRGYKQVFQTANIWIGFRNTFFYVIIGTLFSMVITVLGAYALSLKGYMLKKPILLFIIFTMFFNGGMIPTFLIVQKMGITNTPFAMIIPGALSVWNLIVLRTSFETVPVSLMESAKLDGAGQLRILLKIVLPLSKAALATIVLFYAVSKWGEWYNALVYLQAKRNLYPLQMFLREILVQEDVMETSFQNNLKTEADAYLLKQVICYATIVVATVPILVVYPFVQKYFVKGVMIGAVKE
ncbi:carbohydrate ABC transporter permease [Anaerocolumna sp. AGMB13025]|uniref:carbohydrate ABC transporter permease n=1 Tax=Anaerocolumna sp. AGMB13025 TaxID=3039116 RepID=UPI00241C3EFF|nr:carbohydrate ABC transporter permease [Anaerocolumna sp. AGMB13025]WFR58354.1 carbohydrate ABC transporter permease [Anaerocolumna sp. AGMB13025]